MTRDNSIYNPHRKLLDIEKLADHYKVTGIEVAYKNREDPRAHIVIPPKIDLFLLLHVWISYDTDIDRLTFAPCLRNGSTNYWLTQLLDDHKNKRIDLADFTYPEYPPNVLR